jgi:hypothetical protein
VVISVKQAWVFGFSPRIRQENESFLPHNLILTYRH